MNPTLILKLTALTYPGLLAAGALLPGVVGLRQHLAALPRFIRRLFWVYYGFIGLSLVCFGVGTFFLAEHLASGTPLARAVCGFLALFWGMRWLAGTFLFDLRPYLTNRWRRFGLSAANLVFTCLPLVYGWIALSAPALSSPPAIAGSDSDPAAQARGRELYTQHCAVCHGPDGGGLNGAWPPLAGSEWVLAAGPNRLIRIVLNGLEGPIRVQGKEFQGIDLPRRDLLSDEDVAALLTHIRVNRDWDHHATPVSAPAVKAVREATRTRDRAWTAAELLATPEHD